jgi:hypothetical protein
MQLNKLIEEIMLQVDNILSEELSDDIINNIVLIKDKLIIYQKLYCSINSEYLDINWIDKLNKKINDFKKILKIQNNVNNSYKYIKEKYTNQQIIEDTWFSIKENILEIEKIFRIYNLKTIQS